MQDHRRAEAAREPWRFSKLLLKSGVKVNQVAQGHIQSGIAYLQGWQPHSPSGQPVSTFDCPQRKDFLSLCLSKISCIVICACCPLSFYWAPLEEYGSIFLRFYFSSFFFFIIFQFLDCSVSWLNFKHLLNVDYLQWNQQRFSQYKKIRDAWGIAAPWFGRTLTIHLSNILNIASVDDGRRSTSLATPSVLCFFLSCVFCFLVVN